MSPEQVADKTIDPRTDLYALGTVLYECLGGEKIDALVEAGMLEEDRRARGDRWIADYPDADGIVGQVLHSKTGSFGALCGTPEIDRLIEAGRRETDPALRHAIYREIEETIAREALLVPLFHEQSYRFCQPGVEGLRLTFGAPEVRYEELVVKG